MTSPPRSWLLPSPLMFTASDPGAGEHRNVGSLATILVGGDQPVWQVDIPFGGPTDVGYIVQAEGDATDALAFLNASPSLWHGRSVAVVTTLGLPPADAIKLRALGVTSAMVECYAQADVVHTSIPRMRWAAKQQGWSHVVPVVGCYGLVALDHYLTFAGAGPDVPGNGGPAAFARGHWRGGALGFYLAEGMGDTDSWLAFDSLFTT